MAIFLRRKEGSQTRKSINLSLKVSGKVRDWGRDFFKAAGGGGKGRKEDGIWSTGTQRTVGRETLIQKIREQTREKENAQVKK